MIRNRIRQVNSLKLHAPHDMRWCAVRLNFLTLLCNSVLLPSECRVHIRDRSAPNHGDVQISPWDRLFRRLGSAVVLPAMLGPSHRCHQCKTASKPPARASSKRAAVPGLWRAPETNQPVARQTQPRTWPVQALGSPKPSSTARADRPIVTCGVPW